MDNNEFDVVNPEGVAYVDIRNLIKVFSSTEYDSLEKAASEIVDNAIDANAHHIGIYLRSAFNAKKGKNTLSEIAFLDDGDGMSPGNLQHVVGFGASNRLGNGKIGKFGIGLNQASLFACAKFSVYSWTSQDEVYVEEFDTEYIIENNIDKAFPPKKTTLPDYIKEDTIFKMYCKNHGTLIVWSKIKENRLAKPVTIAKRMKNEFGRVYRYFLDSGELKIYTNADQLENVHAIDPMFLLRNTDVLGDPRGHSTKASQGEPLFELFSHDMLENGCKSYSIPYYSDNGDIKYSEVILRASIIKEKFYYQAALKDGIKQPGDTEIGAYVKEFQKGITIVRNDREIDFNYFGFYDSTNQPQDRWFKIEIMFTEELDDAFHVSNNKQHVELKKISDSKLQDYKEEDPHYPMWLRLKNDINKLLGAMRNRNKALASKSKNGYVTSDNLSLNINENVVKEESLDDILDMFATSNSNVNYSINDTKINDKIEIETTSNEDNSLDLNGTELYDEENLIISYNENLDDWISYEYDFNIKKYMVSFNPKMINIDNLNSTVKLLISNLCIFLCKESLGSQNYKLLLKLLNKYKELMCGGM